MGGVSGSQETSGSGVETSDSSVTGERREVGSSSSVNVDTVGISIVSSSGEQGAGASGPGRARQAVTWGDETGANIGTTTSSPQKQAAQVRSLLLTNNSFHSISSSGQTG